jgi:nitronate monooxygenase
LICQIQDVEAAVEAKAMGADVVVAQGAEAGGHGAVRATLPLVPAVVDAVAPTPVLAAGGIGDGRGVAAALALGAAGAVIGTRFCVAEEALVHQNAKQRLVSARGSGTLRTRVFDTVRNREWPAPYTGRALRNEFLEQWHDRDAELAANVVELERYRSAAERGDFDTALVWAGESVDLVDAIEPASTIVDRIGSQAERWLREAQKFATSDVPGATT